MLGLFRRTKVLSAYERVGSELGVFTLTLTGVDDPFDPDPLWDRRYGGRASIVEHLTGDRDFRLQAALDGCRSITFARDTAGRFRERNPVFTDVVMWIPAEPWKIDARRNGHRIEALAKNLAILHEKKFSGSLPGDRAPSCTVMSDEALAPDTVVFQFGFGVFVPTGEDVLEATIALHRPDSHDLVAIREWSFWHDGGQIKRPVGVYRDQHSLLIVPNSAAPVRAPLWFTRRDGHILLNLNPADSERIYADDERIQLITTKAPKNTTDAIEWVLEYRRGEGDSDEPDRLALRITPLAGPVRLQDPAPVKAVPEGAPAQKAERAEAASGRRVAGGGIDRLLSGARLDRMGVDVPISSRHMLRLVGIGLLRIDGPRRIEGLDEWVIWFDGDGWPVQGDRASAVDTTSCLALSGTSRNATVSVRLAGARAFEPVRSIPCVIPTANGQRLELRRSAIPDRYHGILMLIQEMAFPLSPQPLVLGRTSLRPEAPQPDLPIELLTHPESLRWDRGASYSGTKLNAVHLSRRHATLTLRDGKLDVTMAEGTAPVFVLGEDGTYLRGLEPRSAEHVSLAPEQMFLVGNYLFRFHRERTHTLSTLDYTVVPSDEKS